MTELEMVEAAGFTVVRVDTNHVVIKSPDSSLEHEGDSVLLNADGSLHLIPQRSHFHRRLAAAIGMKPTTLPNGLTE